MKATLGCCLPRNTLTLLGGANRRIATNPSSIAPEDPRIDAHEDAASDALREPLRAQGLLFPRFHVSRGCHAAQSCALTRVEKRREPPKPPPADLLEKLL
eukprot:6197873-Pleurochrysis_carterae.AAC.4